MLTLQQSAIINWRRHHQLDSKLLEECAYYPRGGCQDCSWDRPNPKCERAHILIDTRLDGAPPFQPSPSQSRKRNGRKTAWGVDVESILNRMPKGIRENLIKILNE